MLPIIKSWDKKIQIIEDTKTKKLLLKGQPYMSWEIGDESSERMAIVQLYKLQHATQEELSEIFKIHINSVAKYINIFEENTMAGLISQPRGPKQSWKITPDVRSKILFIVLKEGIKKYEEIQKSLENFWNLKVSIESIRQVLKENGFVLESISSIELRQRDLFDDIDNQLQLEMNISGMKQNEEIVLSEEQEQTKENEFDTDAELKRKERALYSSSQRIYLDELERGKYSAYGGGLLFAPLLRKYNFIPMIERIINIKEYEGYSLEQLCLCLFYFDIFGFESIENFKTAYSDEYGVLIGKPSSPSIYTLRRFLHKVRKLKKGEELIEEFGRGYLRNNLVKWGVLYIDSHFLPYYGYAVIMIGWHTVRNRALKGSYNLKAFDEEFNPLIFRIRPSSEDLLEKIPELINKSKKLAEEVGIDSSNLTVIFDREGYSAELFRKLDGEDWEAGVGGEGQKKIKFITWAKYADQWVYDFDESKFTEEVTVEYKIREKKKIKYFATERSISKYGKIKAIVIKNGPDEKRTAIYTNVKDIADNVIIQLICKRWGQENLIKILKLRHLIDYFPGYIFDELAEQPMVDNPEIIELRKQKSQLASQLHSLELKIAEKIIDEKKDEKKIERNQKRRIRNIFRYCGNKIQNKINKFRNR